MNIRISRGYLVQIGFLVLSILAGFLLMAPLQAAADRRAEIFKNRIIGQLEDSIGIKVQYESISPALLSAVTVRELKISFSGGSFNAERLRVYYNPLRRFGGDENDPIRLISRVTVNDGHLDLELSLDDSNKKSVKPGFDPWPLLTDKAVDLTGISAMIRIDESVVFNADDVSLKLKDDNGNVRYLFDGRFEADNLPAPVELARITSLISSDGSFSPENSTINGRFDVLKAESDFVVMEPLSIDFTFSDRALTARRVDDERPLNLSFHYSPDAWDVSVEAVSLSVRDIASPGPSTRALDPWFSTVMDGGIKLEGSPSDGGLEYDIKLDLSLPPGSVPLAIGAGVEINGSREEAQIELLKLTSDWGDVSYAGSFNIEGLSPDGRFSFNINEYLLGYPVAAAFDLETREGVITANPVFFEAADLEFEDFRFLIIRETDMYTLSMIVVPGKPEDEIVRMLTVDALFDNTDEPVIHGFASIVGVEASQLLRLAGLKGASGLPVIKDSQFNMNGYFEANAESWVISIDDATLQHEQNPDNRITFGGRATPGSWSLDGLRVSWDDYTVDGRGYGKSTGDGGFAEGRLLIDEQVFPMTGRWFQDGKININTDFGMSAVVGPRSINGRTVQFVNNDVSIPLKDGRMISNVDIRGMVARRDWDIYVNKAQVILTDRDLLSDITVDLNGTINPGDVVLPYIQISDNLGQLSGNAMFKSSDGGDQLLGRLFLMSEDDEKYEIGLNREGLYWDIGLDFQSARIERALREQLSGRLNLNGRMTGTLENPLLTLKLQTRDGYLNGQPFEARGNVSMESGRARIRDLHYEHEGVSLNRGLVLLNLNDGSLRSTAELNATYNQVPVSSGFSLAIDFDKKFTLADIGGITNEGFSGTLATRPVLWDTDPHLPAFTFQFRKDSESFSIRTPDSETLNLEYRFDTGAFDILSGGEMPILARGGGTVKDGEMDLSFPELNIDPVLINYVMFRDPILLQYHVIFQSGRFIGNLDITGPTNNPEINGEIRADKLKVDTPYTYAQIKPASTDIHFEGRKITIDRMDIPVGDGIIYGGGTIVLDRLKLVEFDMVYGGRSTGKGDGVPVYYPLMGVNLDGIFTGEVHMTGGDKRFYLDGDFTFPYLKASLGSPIIPVSQAREGVYPTSVFLDFNFITGNNCTFFLPNEQLKIVKATAEAGQVINLVYSTDPKNMSLTGVLPIKSGAIFYFDRDFQITEGALRFNESLGNFDPMMAFRAETRVRDDEGEDVSVALVYNAPVRSDFNPRIETVPARTDLEIMALFGQAVVPYAGSQDNSAANTVLMATGGMFGQMGIVQPFEEVLREGLNLDMVTIQTDIIENTLAEGLSRTNEPELNAQASGLGRYLDNTSLYAGKYIGNALFVSGTVSANYFEGQRLRSVFGGIEFETSVSLEMETPFFNVAWSYSPDPTKTQKFVADNEISLKWQFSY